MKHFSGNKLRIVNVRIQDIACKLEGQKPNAMSERSALRASPLNAGTITLRAYKLNTPRQSDDSPATYSSLQNAGVSGRSSEKISRRPASMRKELSHKQLSLNEPHEDSGPIS